MEYTDRLTNVTVIGAAGKMGSGILLLTAVEMADLSLKPENRNKSFVLNALDISDEALGGLIRYLKDQVIKIAEKKTVLLRSLYADRSDLIENKDIIDQYVTDVMHVVRRTTSIETAYHSNLIFEVATENPALKVKMMAQINQNNPKQPWFFTNTSSIPISKLNKEANLEGRLLGVHFYNPPAVQKLVEVIRSNETKDELVAFADLFIKNLRKIKVPSNDFAGFIGNGHFMRDALHGICEVERLTEDMPYVEALYSINKVTQDFLVRPMGIFQLIDYVGIEVCSYIMSVMNPYLEKEDLHSGLLDKMIALGIRGGQNSNGSQKDGFLKYEKGTPVAIYDIDSKQYIDIAGFMTKCDEKLGALPSTFVPWKAVVRDPEKNNILAGFFADLMGLDTIGAKLATNYGKQSCSIGKQLVADKVALCEEDVNTVILTGFFHAYGPINNYFNN